MVLFISVSITMPQLAKDSILLTKMNIDPKHESPYPQNGNELLLCNPFSLWFTDKLIILMFQSMKVRGIFISFTEIMS